MLQIFLKDSQGQITYLESAWSSHDLAEVRQIAHHIKGASANVGAVTLSTLAAQIEVAARNQQPEAIPQALASLSQSLERLQHSLGNG
nr:Hpt domain-containing protein [Pseudanabaena sp. FACHB-2040]